MQHLHLLLLLPASAAGVCHYMLSQGKGILLALFFLASGMCQKPAAHLMLQMDLVVDNAM